MVAVLDYTLQQYNEPYQLAPHDFTPSDQCDIFGRLIKKDRTTSEFVWFKRNNSATPPSPINAQQVNSADEALTRLRTFQNWKDNWDGEGGSSPDPQLLDFAMQVLSLIANYHNSFVVHLNSDSQPVFYVRNSEWKGEITIEEQGIISYRFKKDEILHEEYDVSIENNTLPVHFSYALTQI